MIYFLPLLIASAIDKAIETLLKCNLTPGKDVIRKDTSDSEL